MRRADETLDGGSFTFDRVQARVALNTLDPAMDDDAWRHAAHSLKGSALGIGAPYPRQRPAEISGETAGHQARVSAGKH